MATATNGIEAIEKASSYRPDVAVIDISMPLMDGIEATEHIHECCRLTRVIILSAYADPEYGQRALEVGAKGYVHQGCSGEVIILRMRGLPRSS